MIETTTRSEPWGNDSVLQELMQDYQAGDLATFGELYRRLVGCLRTLFRRKGLAPDRVDDLVQETFLQIHRARDSYDASRGVKPWVYGVARNVYLMHLRDLRRRYPETVGTDQCIEPVAAPDAVDLPSRVCVRDAVGRVRPGRRAPLIMRHVWGYSFKEIGGALAIGEGAAKVRSHRGMNELRSLLDEPTLSAA
jgi:RNA polymerase sigma-70 factor (ECF subfamily)